MVGLGFGGHHYFSYNHLFALLLLGSNTGNDNSAECRLTTGSAVFPEDYMVHCGPYIRYVIIIIKNKINEKDAT
jgi:hypothetical protein